MLFRLPWLLQSPVKEGIIAANCQPLFVFICVIDTGRHTLNFYISKDIFKCKIHMYM